MTDYTIDPGATIDRLIAERDAALAENKLLRHDVSSYLETVAKVCDMLGVDLESAKSAEGKPSDVLFGYISSMQQRMTAADERADVLEVALRKIKARLDAYAEADMRMPEPSIEVCQAIAGAALKMAQGGDEYPKSCEAAHKALSMENQRIVAPGQFKCLACGDVHPGSGNLPCPKMSPTA